MEMNRSPLFWFAIAVRVSSGRFASSLRVRTTRMPVCSSRASRSRARASVSSFSWMPLGPMAPVSVPPWPGSITIVRMPGGRSGAAAVALGVTTEDGWWTSKTMRNGFSST